MGNKSKKKKNVGAQQFSKPTVQAPAALSAPMITDEQKIAATRRLVALFKKIGEKPEPILDMLYRLEIPWLKVSLPPGAFGDESGTEVEYILIKASDLEAGEQRNQKQGSIVNRIQNENGSSSAVSNPVTNSDNDDNTVSGTPVFVESYVDEPKDVAPQSDSEVLEGNEEYEEFLRGMQG